MSIERQFARMKEEVGDAFKETMRILELEGQNREKAMLLQKQQEEIALLWKRLGRTAPTGEIGHEVADLRGDDDLQAFEEKLDAFQSSNDRIGRSEYLRKWKHDVEQKAAREASLDPLTGLPNRRTFIEDAHRLLNIVREYQEYKAFEANHPEGQHRQEPPPDEGDFSVILLDLDYFKKINDTYGHAAGDEVLKSVAEVLRKHLRPTDEVARWGGEEFIIAFKSLNPDARVIVAEKIRRAIEETSIVFEGHRIPVTASLGTAKWRQGETIAEMIQIADENLYKAKSSGRNRTAVDVTEGVPEKEKAAATAPLEELVP